MTLPSFHKSPLCLSASLLLCLLFISCAGPKVIPTDLSQLKSPEVLGQASQRSYRESKKVPDKKEKLKLASGGIAYAQKCLKQDPQNVTCLYYEVLNTGTYIKNHIPNFQVGLKKMVADCEAVIRLQPEFENGGCYRVLGNIYAQAPSFSLNPKNITQDLDKSVENLRQAVQIAPNYPLNYLFLSRSLQETGDKEGATQALKDFDRLRSPELDNEYPEWKKERDNLAQKLQINTV